MLYPILRFINRLIFRILFRIEAEGLNNLILDSQAIITANHSSFLDPLALCVVIPRRITWIIRKDVYDVWWLRWIFVLTGMVRENGAIGKSLSVLEKGGLIGIFPEGGRSRDGRLKSGRKGIAILALKTGSAVIPCAIKGAYEAYPPTAAFPKPHPVKVLIGNAIRFEKVEEPEEPAIDSALNRIISEIKRLMEQ